MKIDASAHFDAEQALEPIAGRRERDGDGDAGVTRWTTAMATIRLALFMDFADRGLRDRRRPRSASDVDVRNPVNRPGDVGHRRSRGFLNKSSGDRNFCSDARSPIRISWRRV